MTKQITITKGQLITIPESERFEDVIAVQMVHYSINFYGMEIEGSVDTKILKDGRQFVVNGDGWMKEGTEIKN